VNKRYNIFFEKLLRDENVVSRFFFFCMYLVLVAFVGGLLSWSIRTGLAYLLIMIFLFSLVLFNGALYLQDIYEIHDFSKAHDYLLGALFGFSETSLKIMGGKRGIKEGEINMLDRVGGPGKLEVEPGNAVVLETLLTPTRILGAGRHHVERGEMIKEIVVLGEYYGKIDDLIATTRDGIEVKVNDLEFRFCFAQVKQEETLRTLQNPFPFSRQAVSKMVYGRNVNDKGKTGSWTDAVQGVIKGIVVEHITNQNLDALLSPGGIADHPMYELRNQFGLPQNLDKIKSAGARLLWINVGNFAVASPEINQQRLKLWLAKQSGDAKILRAQGEAEKVSSRERGRAESQAVLLRSVVQALEEVDVNNKHDKATTAKNLWNIVLARTAQILESMSSAHDYNEKRE
jgi:hypothetical protein